MHIFSRFCIHVIIYRTATQLTFIDYRSDWTWGYLLFHQSVYQSVCCAFGMWFVFVVFWCARYFDDHYKEVSFLTMFMPYWGVLLPIFPWNFGLFLAANTYANPGKNADY